jgi:hypothetical protein
MTGLKPGRNPIRRGLRGGEKLFLNLKCYPERNAVFGFGKGGEHHRRAGYINREQFPRQER